ncbi:MAG: Wzz/FepE/Etk N-terminal domain-containing protein [Bacteroidota bacterium]
MDSENKHTETPAADRNPVRGWYEFLNLLIRWRGFVLKCTLIVVVFSVVISLLLPNWYKSTVSILPPKESNTLNAGAASSLLRSITSTARIGTMLQGQGLYNYLAILNSRSAMEEVVRRFDLFTAYDIPDTLMESAVKTLIGNVEFEIEPEEYLTITVFDRSPQRAADMANAFAEILNAISIQLATRNAGSNREFLERQVEATRAILRWKEDSLKAYQERSGTMIILDERASGMAAIAEIYAAKTMKEVELAIIERTVSSDNGLVDRMKVELDELTKKVATIPETGVQSMRLLREVLIHQKLLEFLIPLYEQAKIDEQKEVPVLLVLDRAVPAEKKSSPKRSIIVLSAVITAFLASIGWALIVERYQGLMADRPEVHLAIRSLLRIRRSKESAGS